MGSHQECQWGSAQPRKLIRKTVNSLDRLFCLFVRHPKCRRSLVFYRQSQRQSSKLCKSFLLLCSSMLNTPLYRYQFLLYCEVVLSFLFCTLNKSFELWFNLLFIKTQNIATKVRFFRFDTIPNGTSIHRWRIIN